MEGSFLKKKERVSLKEEKRRNVPKDPRRIK